jgi:hypothetical protein
MADDKDSDAVSLSEHGARRDQEAAEAILKITGDASRRVFRDRLGLIREDRPIRRSAQPTCQCIVVLIGDDGIWR